MIFKLKLFLKVQASKEKWYHMPCVMDTAEDLALSLRIQLEFNRSRDSEKIVTI